MVVSWAPAGASGRPGTLTRPCATSIRKPSTPRSSQNRSTDSISSPTSGLVQSKSGWVVSNRWRYHWPGLPSASVTRVQAGPPKLLRQLLGASSPFSPAPSRNT